MDGGRLQCGGIVVERLQELAAKAHVAAGFTGPEMRGQCAAQWPGDAEEVAHSRRAAESLQIVARDDRAHTEADQGKGCIGTDGLIDIYFLAFRPGRPGRARHWPVRDRGSGSGGLALSGIGPFADRRGLCPKCHGP